MTKTGLYHDTLPFIGCNNNTLLSPIHSLDYPSRRYPTETETSPAQAHVSRAWAALLDAAYGGYPDNADSAYGGYPDNADSAYGGYPDNADSAPASQTAAESANDGSARWWDGDNRRSASSASPRKPLVDKFSKDGLVRFPSLTLDLYSRSPAGLLEVTPDPSPGP